MDRSELKRELKKLPLRAIVAFAARCGRRVQPLFVADAPDRLLAIDEALSYAERVAAGWRTRAEDLEPIFQSFAAVEHAVQAVARPSDRSASNAGYAAGFAVLAASNALRAFFRSSADSDSNEQDWAAATIEAAIECANHSAGAFEAVEKLNDADLEKLYALKLGNYPLPGAGINPTSNGPLEPLWPERAPNWYEKGKARIAELLATHSVAIVLERDAAFPLSLYFDLEEFSDAEIVETIAMLSDLYRSVGGDGLVIDGMTLLSPATVPVGV